ncbi:hypothetical protein ACHQM5_000382 [Ranunculus cassubicifolius]
MLCFKELYLFMYRSKILLEISTLLDVFPMKELGLSQDVREQIGLLQKQSRRWSLFIDQRDEALRAQLFLFLDDFEKGRVPDPVELIEFLEEQIYNHEGDVEPTVSVLNGFVALTRYCRFLLFGFKDEEEEEIGSGSQKKPRRGLICQEIGETFLTVPKDFCCPISLDLMHDPVIVSTGQTYDRYSIFRWMEEGHCTCPKTGQMLAHIRLVSNCALRSLINQWCTAHEIVFDAPDFPDVGMEVVTLAASTKAAMEANKATAALLIEQLSDGSQGAKVIASQELRLLAKTGKENRACIAEAGAIPLLRNLLPSPNPVAQENLVTAILNLSIHEKNRSRIMEETGVLGAIVQVLRFGLTTEAKENAAATLFSLSAVHDYKKRISDENGAVEALVGLLTQGSARGKKDVVTALFNLSTHVDNCRQMIDSGAVSALVGALGTDGVAEEAAGALALLVRQPIGAEAVSKEETAISGLLGMMHRGTPRGKENAVAALLELCRSGGTATTQRVVRSPALAILLQTLLVCQRCEASALPLGGWGVGYSSITGNSTTTRSPNFGQEVTVPYSISVPVL